MSIGVRVSGAWKNVNAASVRVGGAWKTVAKAYVKVSGVWKELLATRGPASLIDRTTGTNIGTLTTGSGLAAAFDGVTNQVNSSSARMPGTTTSYIGKTTAVPTAIESVTTFGSNDRGYLANNAALTITLYGKQGSAPSSATNGTPLGSISFTDTGDESTGRQINSSDTATYWDHIWIHLSSGSSAEHYVAELQMTGWQ